MCLLAPYNKALFMRGAGELRAHDRPSNLEGKYGRERTFWIQKAIFRTSLDIIWLQ